MPSAGAPGLTGRRTRLPAPRPDTEGVSLWNLLCKNIGKDLSQVSMPVTINEPLNMLQVIIGLLAGNNDKTEHRRKRYEKPNPT